MTITLDMIKELRERTSAPMMECKRALTDSEGDLDKAQALLRERGVAVLAKRDAKAANEGAVFCYIHTGGKIGVMVELNCETDFVARTDEFQSLGHDLALQIAWSNPLCIDREELDPGVVEAERKVHEQWSINEKKPEKAIPKIIEGRMEKFYEANCLMDQVFVKDDKLKIRDLLNERVSKLGEKIVIKRFGRFRVGETNDTGSDEKSAGAEN